MLGEFNKRALTSGRVSTYHWVSWVSEHLSLGELVSGRLMPGE